MWLKSSDECENDALWHMGGDIADVLVTDPVQFV